jgi:hypothetical protein
MLMPRRGGTFKIAQRPFRPAFSLLSLRQSAPACLGLQGKPWPKSALRDCAHTNEATLPLCPPGTSSLPIRSQAATVPVGPLLFAMAGVDERELAHLLR